MTQFETLTDRLLSSDANTRHLAATELVSLLADGLTQNKVLGLLISNRRSLTSGNARVAIVNAGGVRALVEMLQSEPAEDGRVSQALSHLIDSYRPAHTQSLEANVLTHLFQRLRSGSGDALVYGTEVLAELMRNTSARSAVIEGDILPRLVEILTSGPDGAKRQVLSIIGAIVDGSHAGQSAALDAGAAEPLVEMLLIPTYRSTAIVVTSRLFHENAKAQNAVVNAGIVPFLVDLVAKRIDRESAVAAYALAALADGNPASQKAAVAAGAIHPLIRLLETGLETNVFCAASALSKIAGDSNEHLTAMMEANAVETLVKSLRLGISPPVAALIKFVTDCPSAQYRALVAGAVPLLLKLMESADDDVATNAVLAIARMMDDNAAVQRAVLDFDGGAKLVAVVDDGSMQRRFNTLYALRSLTTTNAKAQIAANTAGAAVIAVSLLRADDQLMKLQAAYTLSSLVHGYAAAQTLAQIVGAVEQLLAFARVATIEDAFVKTTLALVELVKGCAAVQDELILSIDIVVGLLNRKEDKTNILIVLHELLKAKPEAAVAILKTGGVFTIVKLLDSPAETERAVTNSVISCLVDNNSKAKDEVVDAGAIEHVAKLLRFDSEDDVERAVALLHELTHDCRHAQQAAAACGVVEALLVLIRLESVSIRRKALVLVMELVRNNDACDKAVEAGVISVLVDVLQTREELETTFASLALTTILALNAASREEALNAVSREEALDAIPALVRLLHIDTQGAINNASLALQTLMNVSPDACQRVVEADGVARLVELLHNSPDNIKERAVSTLQTITANANSNPLIKVSTRKTDVIPMLVALLSTESQLDKASVLCVLQNLMEDDKEMQATVVASGAIAPFVELVRSERADLVVMSTMVLGGLLADCDEDVQEELTKAGAIETLVNAIRNGSDQTKLPAMMLLGPLVAGNAAGQAIAVQEGVLEPLTRLAQQGPEDLRAWAVLVVGCLMEG